MTEILGSDDPVGRGRSRQERPAPPARAAEPLPARPSDGLPAPLAHRLADPLGDPVAEPPPGGQVAEQGIELLGDDWDEEVADTALRPHRRVLAALGEPGSLAVASALCVAAAALTGPSYRFDAYPFNQGVSSLQVLTSNALTVHPLHDYLTASAPNVVLALVALLTGLFALLRGRDPQARWARPLAAGALLTSVVVVALLGLGAYRTSTYDLAQQRAGETFGTSG